jgi:hypothetical protein
MKGLYMFITSKLASSVDYTFYTKGENGINVVTDIITINGGADVINKKTLQTPQGIVTEVADDILEKLKSHPVFQTHLKNGYITILSSEKEANKADKDLKEDKSKQLTPKDYTKKGKKAPRTSK